MQCYYKEFFGLGMLATLFIFGTIFLFWDEVEKLFSRIQNILKVKKREE